MDGDGGPQARSLDDYSGDVGPDEIGLVSHARYGFALKPQSLLAAQCLLVDVLLLVAAAGAALLSAWAINELVLDRPYMLLRNPAGVSERAVELVMLVALLLAWFVKSGHYTRRLLFWTETKDILAGVVLIALLDSAIQYMTKDAFSRLWMLQNWVLAAVLLVAGRAIAKRILRRLGLWQLPTLVIGRSADAEDVVAALGSEPDLGYGVTGVLDPIRGYRPSRPGAETERIDSPALAWANVAALCRRQGIKNVILAYDQADLGRLKPLLRELARHDVPHAIVPPLRGIAVEGLQVQHFMSHDVVLMQPRNNLARRFNRAVKRAFDLLASACILVLISPIMAIIAALVARDGGPVLFAQTRIGMHGRRFRCLKFRTMVPDAEEVLDRYLSENPEAAAAWARDFKLRDDPRIIPLGRFLRKNSLDELPQLFNTLRGEMSLVGPRPIVESEQPYYGEDLTFYLQVRPGITGLWQVSGRNDVSYPRRVALDGWYVRNWSLWHDIAILCGTVPAVLRRDGAY